MRRDAPYSVSYECRRSFLSPFLRLWRFHVRNGNVKPASCGGPLRANLDAANAVRERFLAAKVFAALHAGFPTTHL